MYKLRKSNYIPVKERKHTGHFTCIVALGKHQKISTTVKLIISRTDVKNCPSP